jgi:hypothetical protein
VYEDLGLAGRGHEFATLTRRDTTQAERAFSKNYSPGDVIQPERDYPRAGLSRGALYEVLENGPGNRLTVRGEKAEVVGFSPMTCRRLSIYEPEHSELAAGDCVRITRNDAALDLANGDRFTVAGVTPSAVTLTNGARTVTLRAEKPLHLDPSSARRRTGPLARPTRDWQRSSPTRGGHRPPLLPRRRHPAEAPRGPDCRSEPVPTVVPCSGGTGSPGECHLRVARRLQE